MTTEESKAMAALESDNARLSQELAGMTQERDYARFAPLGDNHHNALACPYCSPKYREIQERLALLESENAFLRARRIQVAEVLDKMHKRLKSQRRSRKGRSKERKNLHTENARLRAALAEMTDWITSNPAREIAFRHDTQKFGLDELLEPTKGATDAS